MTEAEWLAASDTKRMLRWLTEDANARKLQLFACACCRAIWYLLIDERARRAVEVAERFADGLATEAELTEAHVAARLAAWSYLQTDGVPHRLTQPPASYFPDDERAGEYEHHIFLAATEAAVIRRTTQHESSISLGNEDSLNSWYSYTPYAQVVASLSSMFGLSDEDMAARETAHGEQCHFLRDIFGNPYRPVSPDHSWLTSTVVALARQMYDSRDYSPMPILADAVQDAGCENEDILNHCRGSGPHVRGCWVVDLVLGKA